MKIISKVKVFFRNENPDRVEDREEKDFTVVPSPNPQVVPDWVAESEHFALLKADGSIIDAETFLGPTGKPSAAQLALMSDDELENELQRRRSENRPALVPEKQGSGSERYIGDKGLTWNQVGDGRKAPSQAEIAQAKAEADAAAEKARKEDADAKAKADADAKAATDAKAKADAAAAATKGQNGGK